MGKRGQHGQTERWQRRERKLRKRREAMPVSGAGLKKVIIPLVQKKAEEAEERKPTKQPP